jgi:hypothetical protein
MSGRFFSLAVPTRLQSRIPRVHVFAEQCGHGRLLRRSQRLRSTAARHQRHALRVQPPDPAPANAGKVRHKANYLSIFTFIS